MQTRVMLDTMRVIRVSIALPDEVVAEIMRAQEVDEYPPRVEIVFTSNAQNRPATPMQLSPSNIARLTVDRP